MSKQMTHTVTEVEGATLIKLKRPPVNAFDLAGFQELEETFRLIDHDRAVILAGTAEIFSGGVDTKAIAGYSDEQRLSTVRAITRMITAILDMPGPVVAAVNGHALGGGFVLMLCTDYRLAADNEKIKLGLTEAKAGVPFPAGALAVVRHELPATFARQLTLSSRHTTPQEMHYSGVIDELIPADMLLRTALERAISLAAQPAFRPVKQQMRGPLIRQLRKLAAEDKDPFEKFFAQS